MFATSYYMFILCFKKIYLLLREREKGRKHEQGEVQREEADLLLSREPDARLDLRVPRLWAKGRGFTDWATQALLVTTVLNEVT